MSNKNKASLIVTLEGENTIDVATLMSMLTHYVMIAERANQIVGQGDYKAQVKVKALNEGSFEISLEVVTTWIENLLSRSNVSYAGDLASCIGLAFVLYKELKGKKVQDTEETKQALKTDIPEELKPKATEVYNDAQIRESMRKAIEAASNDDSVRGITISADGKEYDTIEEKEFPDLIIPPKDETPPGTKELIDERAVLSIISLSFNKGDKWKFIYKGHKISTRLSDDGLQEAIDRRVSFAKGDALEVKLVITQKWNDEYKAYVNDKYKVLEVIKHIKAQSSQNLFTQEEVDDNNPT